MQLDLFAPVHICHMAWVTILSSRVTVWADSNTRVCTKQFIHEPRAHQQSYKATNYSSYVRLWILYPLLAITQVTIFSITRASFTSHDTLWEHKPLESSSSKTAQWESKSGGVVANYCSITEVNIPLLFNRWETYPTSLEAPGRSQLWILKGIEAFRTYASSNLHIAARGRGHTLCIQGGKVVLHNLHADASHFTMETRMPATAQQWDGGHFMSIASKLSTNARRGLNLRRS